MAKKKSSTTKKKSPAKKKSKAKVAKPLAADIQKMVDLLPAAVQVIDKDGVVIYANKTVEAIFGVKANKATGEPPVLPLDTESQDFEIYQTSLKWRKAPVTLQVVSPARAAEEIPRKEPEESQPEVPQEPAEQDREQLESLRAALSEAERQRDQAEQETEKLRAELEELKQEQSEAGSSQEELESLRQQLAEAEKARHRLQSELGELESHRRSLSEAAESRRLMKSELQSARSTLTEIKEERDRLKAELEEVKLQQATTDALEEALENPLLGRMLGQEDSGELFVLRQSLDEARQRQQALKAELETLRSAPRPETDQSPDRAGEMLRAAVEAHLGGGALPVAYQPIFDLAHGRMLGLEALPQLSLPDHGPLDWARLVEETRAQDLLLQLAGRLLVEVCRSASGWISRGFDFTTTLNLSAWQLSQEQVVSVLGEAMRIGKIPANRLMVELHRPLVNPALSTSLEELGQAGIGFALDGFGKGPTCFETIGQSKLLKLDPTLIRDLPGNPRQVKAVKAALGLAQSLGKTVCAVGVETEEQVRWLRRNQCHLAQGPHLSPPLQAELVEEPARWGLLYG